VSDHGYGKSVAMVAENKFWHFPLDSRKNFAIIRNLTRE